jgi:hypothetical protein
VNIAYKGSVKNLSSGDGDTITFTLPHSLIGPLLTYTFIPGTTYDLYLGRNDVPNGIFYTVGKFTVTSSGGSQSAVPNITSVTPISGAIGTRVTVRGTGFSPTGNNLYFSPYGQGCVDECPKEPFLNLSSTNGAITFNVPSTITQAGSGGVSHPPTTPGVYYITVYNSHGDPSNDGTFTVTAGNNPPPPPPPSSHPTASLIARLHNDDVYSNDVTISAGETIDYAWASTNGLSYSSSYTNTCSPGSVGAWSANTANGNSSGVIAASQAGCTYVITYRVTGSGGIAQSDLTVRVRASSNSGGGGGGGNGNGGGGHVNEANVLNALRSFMAGIDLQNQTANINTVINQLLNNLKTFGL